MGFTFYQTIKLLHVFGAILFLGNIIVTAFWKHLAVQTKQPRVIAFSQRLVTITDLVFTMLGAVLVLMTGLTMTATLRQPFWHISWLAWGFGLFALSGLIWLAALIPIQVMQAGLAREFRTRDEVPARYYRLHRTWMIFGATAILIPLITLYFMVFKPS